MGGKVVVVVTGANRGLGKAIAEVFDERYAASGTEATFVLTGRNEAALSAVKASLTASKRTHIVAGDMSHPEDVAATAKELVEKAELQGHEKFIVVNNAGTLGAIEKKTAQFTNVAEMQQFFLVNNIAPMCITAEFATAAAEKNARGCIVNISSLFATVGEVGFGMYCPSRAARDMFTAVAAKEGGGDDGDVVYLSYAPGPLDTDMQAHIRSSHVAETVRSGFTSLQEKGNLLTCAASAAKLFDLLAADDFQSGAHIDYFDETYPKRGEAEDSSKVHLRD